MARKPLRPLIRSGGFYPSRKWTPLVYAGGYTTANGGGEPTPPPIEKTIIGNPIHILDALAKPAQALSIALEPIQDLHGYDNPWPAGGGKNKFDVTAYTSMNAAWTLSDGTLTSNNNIFQSYISQIFTSTGETVTISCKATCSETRMYCLQVYNRDTDAQVFRHEFPQGTENFSSQLTLPVGTNYEIRFFGYGASSGTASITNIQLELGSTATSYAPYSNLCPISGHTDADVTRTGVNVWDEEWEVGRYYVQDGQKGEAAGSIRCKNLIPIRPNTTYYKKAPTGSLAWNLYYDRNQTYIGYVYSGVNNTFTTPDNAYYMALYTEEGYGATYNHDISINYPSTDTGYHSGADNETQRTAQPTPSPSELLSTAGSVMC